jgi:hypothetical protein
MVAFKTSSQLFQFGINTILHHELDFPHSTHCDLAKTYISFKETKNVLQITNDDFSVFLGCLHDAILHMILQKKLDLGYASGIPFEISKRFFFSFILYFK